MLKSIVLQLAIFSELWTFNNFYLLAKRQLISVLLFPFDGVEYEITKGRLVGRVRKLFQ